MKTLLMTAIFSVCFVSQAQIPETEFLDLGHKKVECMRKDYNPTTSPNDDTNWRKYDNDRNPLSCLTARPTKLTLANGKTYIVSYIELKKHGTSDINAISTFTNETFEGRGTSKNVTMSDDYKIFLNENGQVVKGYIADPNIEIPLLNGKKIKGLYGFYEVNEDGSINIHYASIGLSRLINVPAYSAYSSDTDTLDKLCRQLGLSSWGRLQADRKLTHYSETEVLNIETMEKMILKAGEYKLIHPIGSSCGIRNIIVHL